MFLAVLELIIILIHCLLLAFVYSAVLLTILLIMVRFLKISFLSGLKNHKKLFWTSTACVILIGLLCYRFSYERDTGLGDNSRVPVGYGQTVQTEEFQWTYFFPNPEDEDTGDAAFIIGNYALKDNKLCAEVSHEYSDSPDYDYIVYNLETRKSIPFQNVKEYTQYTALNNLPLPDEFKDFTHYYSKFIDRPQWKRWLLP